MVHEGYDAGMSSRTYGQYCAVARALDVVGDRWSLLVVRELLTGPKRYTDLRQGLPGIATDMLAARLRELEAAGVVARRDLPPPAASKVYELTADGRELEPALLSLARWGIRRLAPEQDGEFRPHWLELSLRSAFRPDEARDLTVTVDVVLREGRLRARVDRGELAFDVDAAGPADVVITADAATLATAFGDASARADAVAAGRMRVEGPRRLVAGLQRAFAS